MSKPTVIAGVSGGVDSAVSLLRLKEQGYDVQALHMTNWDEDDVYCTAADDYQTARKVCEQLKIPMHRVNFAEEYREQVFADFLAEYKAGRTPNPDVLCNRYIKFGEFLRYAERLGGDYIATGHYAGVAHEPGESKLLRSADKGKDQTYFLHAVKQKALQKVLFPLADLQKSEVRRLANDHGLANFDRKDSTGICFIGERPFKEFLANYIPAQPGTIETPDGVVLGKHDGLMYYTLGQRQGLFIGGHKDFGDEPWYVGGKDLERNVLIAVQGRDNPLLLANGLTATNLHWIADSGPSEPLTCTARTRYRQQDEPCELEIAPDGTAVVRFAEPQWAVTPGQYAVFYDGEVCLGGGVIQTVDGISEASSENHAATA